MPGDHGIRFRSAPLARLTALAFFGLAAWMVYAIAQNLATMGGSDTFEIAFLLLFNVFIGGGLVAFTTWLAARLWWQFSAATVRWASVATVAIITFSVIEAVDYHFGLEQTGSTSPFLPVVLIIWGAVAYRWISRRIIARAGLSDPTDLHGQPVGHGERVKAFSLVLGWGVWLATWDLTRPQLFDRPAGWSLLLGLSPIVLGWLTYRVVLWSMTPRTRAALAPGGLQVLPGSSPPKDVA